MPACVAYLFERDMVAQPEERQEPEERQSGVETGDVDKY